MKIKNRFTKTDKRILQDVFNHFNKTCEWPKTAILNVKYRNYGRLREIAQNLGHDIIDPGGEYEHAANTRLTIKGVYLCRDSERILRIFMNTIRLCVARYIKSPTSPIISGSEIFTKLQIDHNDLRKIYLLLKEENKIWGSLEKTDDPISVELTLKESIMELEGVSKIEEYIKIAYDSSPWYAPQPNEDIGQQSDMDTLFNVQLSNFDALFILQFLCPAINENCRDLVEKGAYLAAVENGFKLVRDRLRDLSGYERGSDAFGRGRLRVNGAPAKNVEKDFNDAVKFLTMAIDKFRNAKSHTSNARIDNPIQAFEYLSLCSLAMRLLENAEIFSKSTDISDKS